MRSPGSAAERRTSANREVRARALQAPLQLQFRPQDVYREYVCFILAIKYTWGAVPCRRMAAHISHLFVRGQQICNCKRGDEMTSMRVWQSQHEGEYVLDSTRVTILVLLSPLLALLFLNPIALVCYCVLGYVQHATRWVDVAGLQD